MDYIVRMGRPDKARVSGELATSPASRSREEAPTNQLHSSPAFLKYNGLLWGRISIADCHLFGGADCSLAISRGSLPPICISSREGSRSQEPIFLPNTKYLINHSFSPSTNLEWEPFEIFWFCFLSSKPAFRSREEAAHQLHSRMHFSSTRSSRRGSRAHFARFPYRYWYQYFCYQWWYFSNCSL